MKKFKIKTLSNLTIALLSLVLSSCNSHSDTGGKLWWIIIGFPLLGIAYIVGGLVISIFQAKAEKGKSDSTQPVPAIIVGIIILTILYKIFF